MLIVVRESSVLSVKDTESKVHLVQAAVSGTERRTEENDIKRSQNTEKHRKEALAFLAGAPLCRTKLFIEFSSRSKLKKRCGRLSQRGDIEIRSHCTLSFF